MALFLKKIVQGVKTTWKMNKEFLWTIGVGALCILVWLITHPVVTLLLVCTIGQFLPFIFDWILPVLKFIAAVFCFYMLCPLCWLIGMFFNK